MKKNKLILSVFLFFLIVFVAVYLNYKQTGSKQDNNSSVANQLTTRQDASRPDANIIPKDSTAYEVEVAESQIRWSAGKLVGDPLTGLVGILSGYFLLDDEEKLSGGRFVIDMEDMESTNLPTDELRSQLISHLKSDDFFSVSTYPTAQFVITAVEKKTDDNYQITGDLTIKDQTHSLSFPAVVRIAQDKIEAQADFSLDRTVWGIKYGSGKFYQDLGDRTINDNIDFSLNITAKKLVNN